MKDRLKKIVNLIGLITIGITVILAILFFLGINDNAKIASNFNILYYWTLILTVVIAVIAFLVGPILSLLLNLKGLGKSLFFIIGIAVILGLAFILSKGDPNTIYMAKKPENIASIAYYTEVGLFTFYFIAVISIIAVIGSEIRNIIK